MNEAIQGEAEVDQALKAATADRQFAEATFNRYKELLAKNSLSRQEFDGAEARYQAALANERAMEAKKQQILARQQQARSQQDSARTYLSYSRIVSPIDGIVTAKSVDVGTVVMPGTPVLTVEDTARYRLEASLPEEYLAHAKAGASVSVSTEQGQFEGRVAEVVPAADVTSHTFLVKIDLPHDCHCRSGEYGQASFPIGETKRSGGAQLGGLRPRRVTGDFRRGRGWQCGIPVGENGKDFREPGGDSLRPRRGGEGRHFPNRSPA